MNTLRSMATTHPTLFAIALVVAWFALLMVSVGIASSALRRPYGDATSSAIARLAVTVCVLLLVWRMGWLEASGIARLGRWWVWLLALGGTIYMASAGLYSFYGRVALDWSPLRLPAARAMLVTQLAAGLAEEVLFRGAVLYTLVRAWGNTRPGMVGSVVLAALLFAVLHMTQVFTHGVSRSAALLLTLQTSIVAIWWGALVLLGGSIWPAVMLHAVVNAVVAVQGLAAPMVGLEIMVYRRLLWFSVPLGVLGIALLVVGAPHPGMPERPPEA
jgi:membrane protease YdiL (CAAX protease family)